MLRESAHNLSYGQSQRIAIARALLRDAPIFVLDEPTASLDEATRSDIIDMLHLESRRRLCIIVSHDRFERGEDENVIAVGGGCMKALD